MCGWLQDCGHADFCFACVQGLTTCPTCSTTIKGWHLLQHNSPPLNPLVLSLSSAFNSSIVCNTSNQITKKKKKQGLQCVDTTNGDEVLGNDSDDDDDAGLLTWVASLDKDHDTQVSNLESETQVTTTLGDTIDCLAVGTDSQGTQEDNTREAKKRKRNPTQPAPFPRVQTRLRGPPATIKGKRTMKLS